MVTWRALCGLPLAGCLACFSPVEPSTVGLRVRYLQQVPPGLPDPLAVGCAHHFAPVNLEVSTSWGASARLVPAPGGGGLFASLEAERDGEHGLSIVDINFCGAGDLDTPSPASGVSVNNVVLTRTAIEGTRRVFLFRVSARGHVQP